eukprot:TRINITY_DN5495_c0_g1_i7.p1 TRINITY_DN5495_c0_g1~~TRINITY_DN5495_c0_g1_i7.p1  ORF type:complete len:645 (+),score=96.83 TRINITY_DN5495_c0_g1_i7:63-1997(+)
MKREKDSPQVIQQHIFRLLLCFLLSVVLYKQFAWDVLTPSGAFIMSSVCDGDEGKGVEWIDFVSQLELRSFNMIHQSFIHSSYMSILSSFSLVPSVLLSALILNSSLNSKQGGFIAGIFGLIYLLHFSSLSATMTTANMGSFGMVLVGCIFYMEKNPDRFSFQNYVGFRMFFIGSLVGNRIIPLEMTALFWFHQAKESQQREGWMKPIFGFFGSLFVSMVLSYHGSYPIVFTENLMEWMSSYRKDLYWSSILYEGLEYFEKNISTRLDFIDGGWFLKLLPFILSVVPNIYQQDNSQNSSRFPSLLFVIMLWSLKQVDQSQNISVVGQRMVIYIELELSFAVAIGVGLLMRTFMPSIEELTRTLKGSLLVGGFGLLILGFFHNKMVGKITKEHVAFSEFVVGDIERILPPGSRIIYHDEADYLKWRFFNTCYGRGLWKVSWIKNQTLMPEGAIASDFIDGLSNEEQDLFVGRIQQKRLWETLVPGNISLIPYGFLLKAIPRKSVPNGDHLWSLTKQALPRFSVQEESGFNLDYAAEYELVTTTYMSLVQFQNIKSQEIGLFECQELIEEATRLAKRFPHHHTAHELLFHIAHRFYKQLGSQPRDLVKVLITALNSFLKTAPTNHPRRADMQKHLAFWSKKLGRLD